MQLGEFINESLRQIIDGVIDAQKYAQEKGAGINPVGFYYETNGRPVVNLEVDKDYTPIAQMIDFDIAVIVTEGGEIKAGIGVFGGALGLGTQAKNEDSNTSTNRIKFTVPVLLPQHKVRNR